MQVESVKVEMLGTFSVWVNGEKVIHSANKLTKPWQLFCYLVLHREKFVANRKLIAMLWADDLLTDPANVLKNAVYSLRKDLCGGESLTESPIIYSTGGYRFDPSIDLDLDVNTFTRLCQDAKEADAKSTEKLELCRKATRAYKGDFLPQLDQDLWVVPLALGYKRQYIECVHELCEKLWQDKQDKELLSAVSTALEFEPLDEKNIVYLFRAMNELKMYRVIVTSYSRVAQQFKDALSSEMPEEAQAIFNAASERISKTEQDVIVIKTELTGSEQMARPPRGAFYCSYSNLRHMYTLMKRATERNDQVLVLALFTLSPPKNVTVNQYDLVCAMAEFKVVAMNNLRKADALARYSRNQYVMLMSVNSLEDGRLVRDRICDSFQHAVASRKLAVDVKLTEV